MFVSADATVNRTTDGKGKVSDLTLAEIKALDAGAKLHARFVGTRIPTFEEALAVFPKNV
jgi:glycerophosphoryl diester phosphodiesterase